MEKEVLQEQEQWIHYKEVMEKLGISKTWLYELAKEGKLKIQDGFISLSSLKEFEKELQKRKKQPVELITKGEILEQIQLAKQELNQKIQGVEAKILKVGKALGDFEKIVQETKQEVEKGQEEKGLFEKKIKEMEQEIQRMKQGIIQLSKVLEGTQKEFQGLKVELEEMKKGSVWDKLLYVLLFCLLVVGIFVLFKG